MGKEDHVNPTTTRKRHEPVTRKPSFGMHLAVRSL
jgi:acyl-CoA reductase-like NAD-dependent aldehyde dehydrogenase